jgi:hypothetical protein
MNCDLIRASGVALPTTLRQLLMFAITRNMDKGCHFNACIEQGPSYLGTCNCLMGESATNIYEPVSTLWPH